jgi:branched-chain amino acid transport system permease protein
MRQVSFYMGFLAGMKAFTAAVIGGLGSVPGAILGAIVLGLAESLTAGLVSSSYEDAAAFLLLIAVATIRPEGLAGRREAPGA